MATTIGPTITSGNRRSIVTVVSTGNGPVRVETTDTATVVIKDGKATVVNEGTPLDKSERHWAAVWAL